jgi:hypothetical protein
MVPKKILVERNQMKTTKKNLQTQDRGEWEVGRSDLRVYARPSTFEITGHVTDERAFTQKVIEILFKYA